MTKYDIVPGDLRRDTALAALRASIFGATREVNARYLRWKYVENPYLPEPLLLVARHDGRAVGMRGMMGTAWEIGRFEAPVIVPCAADLGIQSAHRDSGLFEELNHRALEQCSSLGFGHVVNLSATPGNQITSIMRLGWRRACEYQPLRRAPNLDHDPSSVAKRRNRSRLRKTARAAVPRRDRAFRRLDRVAPPPAIDVLDVAPIGAMVDLLERLGGNERIRHVRDEAYLRWRYRNPLSTYRFLTWGQVPIEGYLVLKARRGHERVRIVDGEATDRELLWRMVDYAIEAGGFTELETWGAAWPLDDRERLRHRGFERIEGPPARWQGLLIRPSSSTPSEADWNLAGHRAVDQAAWDLRMIYSDAN